MLSQCDEIFIIKSPSTCFVSRVFCLTTTAIVDVRVGRLIDGVCRRANIVLARIDGAAVSRDGAAAISAAAAAVGAAAASSRAHGRHKTLVRRNVAIRSLSRAI